MICIIDCRYFLMLLNFQWFRKSIFLTRSVQKLSGNSNGAVPCMHLLVKINIIQTCKSNFNRNFRYINPQKKKKKGETSAQLCKICRMPRSTRLICLKRLLFPVFCFYLSQRNYFSKDQITRKPGFN